jgi:hypothetical protein
MSWGTFRLLFSGFQVLFFKQNGRSVKLTTRLYLTNSFLHSSFFFPNNTIVLQSINLLHSAQPEGSLQPSQSPPLVFTLSQRNTVHVLPSYFFKVHFNIVVSSPPRSSQWSLPFAVPRREPMYSSSVPHTFHIPRPSHIPDIWGGKQIRNFLVMQFLPVPGHLVCLRPKYLGQHTTVEHRQPMSFCQWERDHFSHSYRRQAFSCC